MSFFDGLKRLFGDASSNGEGAPEMDMISCEDALSLIHEFIDGELEGVSDQHVRAHFDACQRCYPHLHLEEAFRESMQKAARGGKAPPELKSRLVELLAEAAAEE